MRGLLRIVEGGYDVFEELRFVRAIALRGQAIARSDGQASEVQSSDEQSTDEQSSDADFLSPEEAAQWSNKTEEAPRWCGRAPRITRWGIAGHCFTAKILIVGPVH